MGRPAEDLSGKIFGFLKVVERAENKKGKNKSYVMWRCECLLCGGEKDASTNNLKRGAVKSCGCLAAHNGKLRRNERVCVICGERFPASPSSQNVTCSDACKRMYNSRNHKGMKHTEETRKKLSEYWRSSEYMKEVQRKATESAKKSPKAGKFETNVHAVDWHIVSPDGTHYQIHSLNNWLRENCREKFGCEPDSKQFSNVISGFSRAKRSALGKIPESQRPCLTYKGWQVIPTPADFKEKE